MKKSKQLLLFFVLCIGIITLPTSCKTGEGCPTDQYHAKTDKDGNLSSAKRGKSNLFSKKQRKRMGR